MDCRAVVICLLIAQAACKSVTTGTKTGALNRTIMLIREEIQDALNHFNDVPGLLPNTSCILLNITELVGLVQQPLTADHLSSFRCYMLEMPKLTPELSDELHNASQFTQDMERMMGGSTARQNCSLPAFESDIDRYVYVRCLLQLLHQGYSNATF